MGQEIEKIHFRKADFQRFAQRLHEETEQLASWFRDGSLCHNDDTVGFELEAWMVDGQMAPKPVNAELIARLDSPDVVPELAAFNLEFNNSPHALKGEALSTFYNELTHTLQQARNIARSMDSQILLCGTLPTVRQRELNMDSMSVMQRYRALNEQVLRMRDGHPLQLDIQGTDHLRTTHGDVMLEAATTSFQLHIKVSPRNAARIYNIAKIISAPLVAISANAPYLFGCDLWDETRIPLFEQAVDVGPSDYTRRVSFGIRYVHESLMECFEANLHRYPVLMPMIMEDDGTLPHLRLHNGTIWRWNRPLLGFNDDGKPHLRIEHRVIPAGPTARDSIANAAFFFGLINGLMNAEPGIDQRITFEMAKTNFYAAAQLGLDADVAWQEGELISVRELILETLLPLAAEGLSAKGIATEEIDTWLGIIAGRAESGTTGARWQRRWVEQHGRDWTALTRAYADRASTETPVHLWDWQA